MVTREPVLVAEGGPVPVVYGTVLVAGARTGARAISTGPPVGGPARGPVGGPAGGPAATGRIFALVIT